MPAFCRLLLYSIIFATASALGAASGAAFSYPSGITIIMKRIGLSPGFHFSQLAVLSTRRMGSVHFYHSTKANFGILERKGIWLVGSDRLRTPPMPMLT